MSARVVKVWTIRIVNPWWFIAVLFQSITFLGSAAEGIAGMISHGAITYRREADTPSAVAVVSTLLSLISASFLLLSTVRASFQRGSQ